MYLIQRNASTICERTCKLCEVSTSVKARPSSTLVKYRRLSDNKLINCVSLSTPCSISNKAAWEESDRGRTVFVILLTEPTWEIFRRRLNVLLMTSMTAHGKEMYTSSHYLEPDREQLCRLSYRRSWPRKQHLTVWVAYHMLQRRSYLRA